MLGASALSCVALSALAWNLYTPTYFAGSSAARVIRLADGSRVILNSEARVRARLHGTRREIELLRGEAYFDVASDPERPFLVIAGGAVTQALGTRFAVRLDGEQVTVTVRQGRVALRAPAEPNSLPVRVELGPAQTAALNLGSGPHVAKVRHLTSKELRKLLQWTGSLQVNAAPLANLVAAFNRANTLQIAVDDSKLDRVRVSGTVSLIDPTPFLGWVARSQHAAVTGPDRDGVIHLSLDPSDERAEQSAPFLQFAP